MAEAHTFFEKHGGKSLILARFVPFVRTFTPIVAGVARMNYSIFFIYNIVGGFLWSVGITLLGYFLGQIIPDVDKYLLPIIIFIIVISLLPGLFQIWQSRKNKIKK